MRTTNTTIEAATDSERRPLGWRGLVWECHDGERVALLWCGLGYASKEEALAGAEEEAATIREIVASAVQRG